MYPNIIVNYVINNYKLGVVRYITFKTVMPILS